MTIVTFDELSADPGRPPADPCAAERAFAEEQASHRRAMPVQRLNGGGMRQDDALALHWLTENGVAWQHAAEWLGQRNLRAAAAASSMMAKRAWFRFASASFRFGQAAFPSDDDEKRRLHAAMVVAFGRAAELDDPVTEKVEIAWRGGMLCGWLMRPRGSARAPVVIIMGGFDGWREEYAFGAEELVRAGVAAFLVDGPGQGESRLRHGLFLDVDFPAAFSLIAEHLRADDRLSGRVGIWGNSLGGTLAAWVAARNRSIAAVCVNGGSIRPAELPERFPRFWTKVEALVGSSEPARARAVVDALDLGDAVGAITCPLLQLHGTADAVFLLDNARVIHDRAASPDKTLLIWRDGDHCIYNHSEAKNLYVADWFASRLFSA